MSIRLSSIEAFSGRFRGPLLSAPPVGGAGGGHVITVVILQYKSEQSFKSSKVAAGKFLRFSLLLRQVEGFA